jgi:hypothetical protein
MCGFALAVFGQGLKVKLSLRKCSLLVENKLLKKLADTGSAHSKSRFFIS